MKKIFTLFATLILTLSLFAAAHPRASRLTIKSEDRSDIRVVIDGRRFEPYDFHMTISDMQPGYHSVKVYRERNFGIFTIFGQRYDVVFSNSMFIKPYSNVMISIDRFGRAQVFENRMGGRNIGWGDRDWKHDHDFNFDRGRNFGDYGDRDHNWNDRDTRSGDRDNRTGGYGNNGGYGNGGYDNNNGGYGNGGNLGRVMSDNEFNRVLDNISRERGENNMMKSATQIISTNSFTSEQVKEMLQLFSFENNKLDLAKLAYDKTVDQRNFYVVNDVFSYGNSKDELARYIRNH
jgi:hypothetical protein